MNLYSLISGIVVSYLQSLTCQLSHLILCESKDSGGWDDVLPLTFPLKVANYTTNFTHGKQISCRSESSNKS